MRGDGYTVKWRLTSREGEGYVVRKGRLHSEKATDTLCEGDGYTTTGRLHRAKVTDTPFEGDSYALKCDGYTVRRLRLHRAKATVHREKGCPARR